MTADTLRNDPGNALTALAGSARRAPNGWLVGAESIGLAAALAVWIWTPDRWALALPFLALSAYGLWGVVEHVLQEGRRSLPGPVRMTLVAIRFLISAVGVAAAAAAGYAVVGAAIGTVIS
ncbi:MAG: hypothetical protein Q7S20_10035 [Gemmatimonadaceae bacterium]|nr:hypothetical protein [Gemmatimonadaceae bacterium]